MSSRPGWGGGSSSSQFRRFGANQRTLPSVQIVYAIDDLLVRHEKHSWCEKNYPIWLRHDNSRPIDATHQAYRDQMKPPGQTLCNDNNDPATDAEHALPGADPQNTVFGSIVLQILYVTSPARRTRKSRAFTSLNTHTKRQPSRPGVSTLLKTTFRSIGASQGQPGDKQTDPNFRNSWSTSPIVCRAGWTGRLSWVPTLTRTMRNAIDSDFVID